ncbi:hypothetical protein PUN28_011544 [Cardiocondyla obscurior]|uniref:Uncharacterized protein n=1 Tax=Cardiocondyla obscurior TaxID=286306 RepID=A0AAW2FEF9_9HYME
MKGLWKWLDHDPISAERSVHSAIRNARPKKYSRNKTAFYDRSTNRSTLVNLRNVVPKVKCCLGCSRARRQRESAPLFTKSLNHKFGPWDLRSRYCDRRDTYSVGRFYKNTSDGRIYSELFNTLINNENHCIAHLLEKKIVALNS